MTSPAVYCLSLQIRQPSEETTDNISNETDRNSLLAASADVALLDGQKSIIASNSLQQHQLQPQQQKLITATAGQQQQQQQHSNIILVRGARTENGQIILQNSHELLNLLNDEENPLLLQHSRLKSSKPTNDGGFLFQSALKGSQIDGTVLLQSATVKKSTTLPEGSIIVQQRLNKNGTVEGPILLQTLKRLDKSQSIFVFRNPNSNSNGSNSNSSVNSGTSSNNIKNNSAGNSNNCSATVTSVVSNAAANRKNNGEESDEKSINTKQLNTPIGNDGEPIKLPDNLESLPRADHFPVQRHRWNTNEEIAAILINFDKHSEWQSKEVRTRPKSGSMLLYSRKKVRYRRDGYCWKKRKDGKTTREDHMKLKVQGTECIYGCYVHSAILPTFHRRCYWLLQNPDIVLVHYLNVPYPDDNKMAVITPSLALWGDKKEWTKEELVSQLKPMFFSEDETDANNEIELSKFQTAETVEAIVSQLMEKQRLARQAALVKQLECGCPDSTCADGKSCSHPMRRISAAKSNDKRQENNNQVSSTTPNVLIGPRLYSRWVDRRGRDQLTEISKTSQPPPPTAKCFDGPIHFQVIPTTSQTHTTISNHLITRTNSNITNNDAALSTSSSASSSSSSSNSLNPTNNQQQLANATNVANTINHNSSRNNTNNNMNTNHMSIVANRNSSSGNNGNCGSNNNSLTSTTTSVTHPNQISMTGNLANHNGHNMSVPSNQNRHNSHHNHNHHHHHQQQQQQQHTQLAAVTQTITDTNGVNHGTNIISSNESDMPDAPIVSSASPLVLSLSQIQGTGSSLLILNGQQQSFVCQSAQSNQHQQQRIIDKPEQAVTSIVSNLIPKQEAMDLTSSMAVEKQPLENTFENFSYSAAQQHIPISSPSKSASNLDSLPFFNETLELSQEDIQKTLSANMPIGDSNEEPIGHEINPMDFINNCCEVGPSVNDDDVFVNLDAFDMFVEFPDLELDAKSHFLQASDAIDGNGDKLPGTENGIHKMTNESNQDVYNISDYSPEWAYTEGGVKVLVTGPWDPNSNYTVLFDAFPVPTTIVQSGVLRCYCPAHEVGLATLQVACDGYVISNSVIFEYKSPPNTESICEGAANDSLYKLSLYNRLESIDDRMQIKTEPKDLPDDVALFTQTSHEDRLVTFCQILISKQWKANNSELWTAGYKGMTLLHLASALGYPKLVCIMLTWRSENPNVILDAEIDALSQDNQGYTPLMWSCAKGHSEVATILYKWNYNALNVKNRLQQTSLDVARTNGFANIAADLERFENNRERNNFSAKSLSVFSTTLNQNRQSATSHSNSQPNYAYTSFTKSILSNPVSTANNTTITTTISTMSTITTANIVTTTTTSTTTTTTNSATAYIPSTYSIASSPISLSHKDNLNEQTHNPLDNESSQCSSPMSIGSLSSLNSNRSHDGVFLRPGAVSSSQSPPAITRLTKRTSVDSGINVDVRTCTSKSGRIIREQSTKPSKYDRSMSLPMANSPLSFLNTDVADAIDQGIECSTSSHSGGNQSFSNMSLLSPLRKMDFALCEAADSSPNPHQQAANSDGDEDSHHLDTDIDVREEEGGVVGESDAKVLTLAEQIIAAMPERIKNESVEMMSLGSPISESLGTDAGGIGVLNDSFIEPLLDTMPSSNFDQEFNFEFSDHSYRYHDVGTPCSSLSPASSGPLQSPASYSIAPDPPMGSPSPPPTTQDFTEFLHASNSVLKPFEADFSNLTLTDIEQRELYEAAKCIQKAYRSYKGRKKLEEQDKERSAAIVIQNYYRRYKQYAYYRQMTQAALIIQNGYRSYCEHKRFKKSQNQSSSSSAIQQDSQCLQTYYKHYQSEQQQIISPTGGSSSKEPSPSGPLKRTYSQRTQNQAARKIQQFMRQSKLKLQRERAEKERLVHQHRAEYPQNLPYPVLHGIHYKQEQSDNSTQVKSAFQFRIF